MTTKKPQKEKTITRLCDNWLIGEAVYMLTAEASGAVRKLEIQQGSVYGIFLQELQVVICNGVTKHVPLDSCYHTLEEMRNAYIKSIDDAIETFKAKKGTK